MKTRAEKIAEAKAAGLSFPHPEPPENGAATEVAPGILWARLPLPMALDHVNVYLLDDGESWTLVDTGMDTPDGREGWERLFAGSLAGKPVGRVIATHFHPDHSGLAGWLCRRSGAELLTTRTSFLYARMLQLDAWDDLPEDAERFYRRAGFDADQLATLRARAKFGFARVCSPLPLGFRRIVEGETLLIGGRDWRIVCGHGHAPEHAVLVCDAERLVLAGDQVLPRITSNIGVYPTEPHGDPLGEWLASCAALQDALPHDALVLPGHNEPFFGVHRRLAALIAHHGESLSRLEAFLSEPRRAVDCFDVLFDRKISAPLLTFATVETVAHLNHLLGQGRAALREEDGVALFAADQDQFSK